MSAKRKVVLTGACGIIAGNLLPFLRERYALTLLDIRDGNGVPFQIFYGISGNPHAFWSIANARKIIGCEPDDNSEIRFRERIDRHIQAAEKAAAHEAQPLN